VVVTLGAADVAPEEEARVHDRELHRRIVPVQVLAGEARRRALARDERADRLRERPLAALPEPGVELAHVHRVEVARLDVVVDEPLHPQVRVVDRRLGGGEELLDLAVPVRGLRERADVVRRGQPSREVERDAAAEGVVVRRRPLRGVLRPRRRGQKQD
jgi:hypothetical protein